MTTAKGRPFRAGQTVYHWNRGAGTFHMLDHWYPEEEAWVSFDSPDPDRAERVTLAALSAEPPETRPAPAD